jgi:thiol-disulfide isomerase/thioredoxin
MNPLLYLAALVALATVLGLVWQRTQGRVRRATGEAAEFAPSGAHVTLLQFSTEVCAPCRATHGVLERIASETDAVAHVDLDITHRPDLAARFTVLQTPTTLILDRDGAIVARIGGAVKPAVVRAHLDTLLETV